MKRDIFDTILGGVGLQRAAIGGSIIPIKGYWDVKVVRANGDIEEKTLENIVTANGLNLLADRLMLDTNSKAGWIAVGSWLTSPTLSATPMVSSRRGTRCRATAWT